ncbi:MAG: hypothetical protein CVV64_15075 [Candidatus Wallbacteria bacterium HGW-Wallbacteria-1]|jgi:parvulin-like peptidyl-prolyl isomerase|uniref:PpiC domain-containing protein n=1 Tax=Candidatus Wallbacteria bacterium HGW-Wallbacteria-1 TaxID=2013854 RepID=A0A2N1PLV4_9BACT|nr:MAG: hypothetical protein CVV64_15075 [Candidatus Wallbacteria bacterium HGW-Wallbacteria-1]
MLRLRGKGIIKWTIWAVVSAFVLSIFLFAGMFFSGSDAPVNNRKAADGSDGPVREKTLVFKGDEAKTVLAKVGDRELTLGEVEGILNTIDPKYRKQFTSERGMESLIDQLVTEEIKQGLVKKLGLDFEAARDAEVQIKAADESPQYKKFGGYRGYIEAQGMNWDIFHDRVKQGIADSKLRQRITSGKVVTDEQIEKYFADNRDVLYREKEIENVREEIRDILASEVTDADLKAFYEQYDFLFKSAPLMTMRHILVKTDSEKIKAGVAVTDEEIKSFYDANKTGEYGSDKAVVARQILVKYNDQVRNSQLMIPEKELQNYFDAHTEELKVSRLDELACLMIPAATAEELQAIQVSAAEIGKYYEENKALYVQEESARASHILLKVDAAATDEEWENSKKTIEGILAEIKGGKSFEEMAKAHSGCPSSAKGGDLGSFVRGQMVKPFEDVAFNLANGELSAPVRTVFGWHIIRGNGVTPKGPKPLAEVSDMISLTLKERRSKEILSAAAKTLRGMADNRDKASFLALRAPGNIKVISMDLGNVADNYIVDSAGISLAVGKVANDKGNLETVVAEAIDGLAAGKVTDVIELEGGYAIFMVVSRQDTPETTLNLVRTRVADACRSSYAKTHYREVAEKILSDLKKKVAASPDGVEDAFAEFARNGSDGKTAPQGGLLPRVFKGRQPKGVSVDDLNRLKGEILAGDNIQPTLESVIFNLSAGQFTDVVETPFGFHIIYIKEVQELDGLPFELVKDEIKEKLTGQKADEAAKSKTEKIREEIAAGAEFATVARANSDAKSAVDGGLLENIPADDAIEGDITEKLKGELGDSSYRYQNGGFAFGFFMEPEIVREIKFLREGDLSQVIKTRFGYHIIRLETVKDSKVSDFDKVKDEIKSTWFNFNVSDDELKKAFEARKESFKEKDKVVVRQILSLNKGKANEALAKAREGVEPFEELVKTYSVSSNAAEGGLMTVERGEMYPQWEDAVFNLKEGQISDLIETSMGHHIVKLESRKEAVTPTFESKREDLRTAEVERKKRAAYTKFIEKISGMTRAVLDRDAFVRVQQLIEPEA